MTCTFCKKDDSDKLGVADPCLCPPVTLARPAWAETYPPLHCIRCGTPIFKLPQGHPRVVVADVTCSPECRKEIELRYVTGTIMRKPYEAKR